MFNLEAVTGNIISMAAGHAIERAQRTEWYTKIISKLGLDPNHVPQDFEGLYLYTIVTYGMGKQKEILNFFRQDIVKDIFRRSIEEQNPKMFIKHAGEYLCSEEGLQIGFPTNELQYEFEGFKSTFEILLNRSKSVQDILDDQMLSQINDQVGFLLDEIERLKKEQGESWLTIERSLDILRSDFKLEKSKSSYDEVRKEIRNIRKELKEALDALRPQVAKFLKSGDIAEFEEGYREIDEVLERLESGFIWVTLFGATSSGKSAISNSLIGEDIAIVGIEHDLTIEPTPYQKKGSPWMLVDVPGILGEKINEEVAIAEAKKAHGLVFVVTGEPLGPELKLFDLVHETVPNLPILVFVNKWDLMNNVPKRDREKVRSLIENKMRKFVKSSEDIVYGSAMMFDRELDEMVRQPLPQLIDRMYASVGTFGEVVRIIDPANRAVDVSTHVQERLFEMRSGIARKLIRYFGWASIVGNVMLFDELLVTPGILATMTYTVLNVMGIKTTKDSALKISKDMLKICAQDLTFSFVGVAIASTVLNALGPIGLLVDVAGLSAIKYSRTVTLGEVLIEYVRTDGTWDGDRHKAVMECRNRAQSLYSSFKR